jgi:hypothetical protein
MKKVNLIFPFILFSLLTAIWTGWIRIGWAFPVDKLAAQHGGLMVDSFLASLIFLERAVAFRSKWILLLPFVNAFSIVAFAVGLPSVAEVLFVAGSAGFVVMCLYFVYRFKELYYYIFLVGALCLLTGNIILYKTGSYPASVNWWIGFLLFTIVAERLELSRFLKLSKFKTGWLWTCIGAVLLALVWPFHDSGVVMLAVSIGLVGLWLLKYDMARHSVKVKGQHRYSGLLLLVGYVWLLVMSVLLLLQNRIPFGYDTVLHSFFIGFIFSMIFSHAVIILPAVTKLPVKLYRPVLYVWFALLQVSLVVRIIADVIGDVTCRKIGGLANGISIFLFFVSVAAIMVTELRKRKRNSVSSLLKNSVATA